MVCSPHTKCCGLFVFCGAAAAASTALHEPLRLTLGGATAFFPCSSAVALASGRFWISFLPRAALRVASVPEGCPCSARASVPEGFKMSSNTGSCIEQGHKTQKTNKKGNTSRQSGDNQGVHFLLSSFWGWAGLGPRLFPVVSCGGAVGPVRQALPPLSSLRGVVRGAVPGHFILRLSPFQRTCVPLRSCIIRKTNKKSGENNARNPRRVISAPINSKRVIAGKHSRYLQRT
jgi:hypothetical protein